MSFEDIRSDPMDLDLLSFVYDNLVNAVTELLDAAVAAKEDNEPQLRDGLISLSDQILTKLFVITVAIYELGGTPDTTKLREEAQPLRDRLIG